MAVSDRHICVLYITATCNLNCRYCFIDKSSVLQDIDKILEDTYKTDYFFNFMKEMFPDPYQLQKIELWGGEPSYGLPRIHKLIKNALDYYPNLTTFMMSTNLTTASFLDDFYGFLNIFKDYPERQFQFNLQLSLDGPTNINDLNRGQGTTQKFTKNFTKLITSINDELNKIPNLNLLMHFKPTLDSSSIAQLQTKQDIINYYKFFDLYLNTFHECVFIPNVSLYTPNPNTACPSPHTIEDGKNFANMCKLIYEILSDDENIFNRNIMPFRPQCDHPCHFTGLTNGCGTCGTGKVILGLLPFDLVSSCHNGFVDLLTDYKTKASDTINSKDRTIEFKLFLDEGIQNHSAYTKKDYALYEQMCEQFTTESLFQMTHLVSTIVWYAQAGMIDEKYKNNNEAAKAAHFIFDRTSSCIRDNIGVTGSRYLMQIGFIKLFLNGAKEYIENADRFPN